MTRNRQKIVNIISRPYPGRHLQPISEYVFYGAIDIASGGEQSTDALRRVRKAHVVKLLREDTKCGLEKETQLLHTKHTILTCNCKRGPPSPKGLRAAAPIPNSRCNMVGSKPPLIGLNPGAYTHSRIIADIWSSSRRIQCSTSDL